MKKLLGWAAGFAAVVVCGILFWQWLPTPVIDESGREVEEKSLTEYLNEGRSPGDTWEQQDDLTR